MIQYRLTFESIDSNYAAIFEAHYGKRAWASLTAEEWEALPWTSPVRRVAGDDIHDQHRTLVGWAQTHDQPIRNVRLERRDVPDGALDWEPIEGDALPGGAS